MFNFFKKASLVLDITNAQMEMYNHCAIVWKDSPRIYNNIVVPKIREYGIFAIQSGMSVAEFKEAAVLMQYLPTKW